MCRGAGPASSSAHPPTKQSNCPWHWQCALCSNAAGHGQAGTVPEVRSARGWAAGLGLGLKVGPGPARKAFVAVTHCSTGQDGEALALPPTWGARPEACFPLSSLKSHRHLAKIIPSVVFTEFTNY